MKRCIWLVSLLLMLFLTSCLCSNQPAPLAQDIHEPNDTREQATVLLSALEGLMNEGEEDDVFLVKAEQGVELSLLLNEPKDMTFNMKVEDAKGNELAFLNGRDHRTSDPLKPLSLSFTPQTTADVYVRLSYVYTGPPDALCWRGASGYTVSVK